MGQPSTIPTVAEPAPPQRRRRIAPTEAMPGPAVGHHRPVVVPFRPGPQRTHRSDPVGVLGDTGAIGWFANAAAWTTLALGGLVAGVVVFRWLVPLLIYVLWALIALTLEAL